MEFVIHVNGDAPEKGFWVLAVDAPGGRFLVAAEGGAFRWVLLADCTFARGATPDIPRPVVLVQQRQGIAVPKLHVGNGRN